MRFNWDESQTMLRDMVERYVADRHPFTPGRQAAAWDDAAHASWRELAELGLLGLPFAGADGGSDGSALDVLLVMQAFGKGLVRLPYLSTVVLAGGVLRHAASAAQKAALLPGVIAGDTLLALAFAEPQARDEPANVRTTARRTGQGYVLDGGKCVVLGAADAHACIVSARTAGAASDRDGISLFLVPAAALARTPFRAIDGQGAADIALDGVHVAADALIGAEGQALPVIERVLAEGAAALCADAVGAMTACFEKCVEHAKTRVAFGKPLAQFQVIEHRLVDMRLACEMAGAMALKAASAFADGLPDAIRAASACKALVNEEAAFVGKAAVQLHGAIGITEELDIGAYFKRLTAMQLMLGGTDHHIRRCASAARATERLDHAD